MKVIEWAVFRPVGTAMLTLAVLLFGVVGVRELAIDLLPAVDMPRISITTAYEGVAPEEMETLVTRPIERPEDGYVSGTHARVSQRNGRVYLADLNSSNGTFVRLTGPRLLPAGSLMLMGQQLFRIQYN